MKETTQEKKTFNVPFTVCCSALYDSSLEVPISLKGKPEQILAYIQEHLDAAPVQDLEWLSDLEPESAVTLEDIKSFGEEDD